MTLQALPIRKIFARFFPRKYLSAEAEKAQVVDTTDASQKQELAIRYLAQGELALLQGNLHALSYFETASQMDPQNPKVWYRQGLAFFEYGSVEGKEKFLLLATKYFKIATQIDAYCFDGFASWGNALLSLGRHHSEYHFFAEAKEKYQIALELAAAESCDKLAELYWDFGIVWSEIAKVSGEAVDLRMAIDAFQKALPQSSPEFYHDFGSAYLEMGLLINELRFFFQAATLLQRSITIAPEYSEGWAALAECYSQLYLNTLDERYLTKASDSFASAVRFSPVDSDLWLSWAEILAESGRHTKDPKLLQLSIEKCARAAAIEPEEPMIIAQWVESLSLLGAYTSRLDLLIEAENKILKITNQYQDDPDLWLSYGAVMSAFGIYYEDPEYIEMAIEKFQWGVSMDRSSAEHWHALGLAHFALGKVIDDYVLLSRAEKFIAKAIDLKPSYPPLLFDSARILLHFSKMADDLASLERSVQQFESLLKGHKDSILYHPEWLFEYGLALEWLGDFSEDPSHFARAIEIFSHVLLISPDTAHLHGHLANCYHELGTITLDPQHYKQAIHFYRLASKQDEENDRIWLGWGVCLIHLANQTFDADFQNQLYLDAEQKIIKAGRLGNPHAHYTLACLYSLLERIDEAMRFIYKALLARTLPPLEELSDDHWLDNLKETPSFTQFCTVLEAKLEQARED